MPFVKMEGAGNDFVMLLAGDVPANLGASLAAAIGPLCDRRRGVGADGVIVVTPLDAGRIDVRYRNRDGSEAFCGNGARCAAALAVARGLAPSTLTLRAGGLDLAARVREVGVDAYDVDVEMPAPPEPPRELTVETGTQAQLVVVGVPHLVVPVPRIDDVALAEVGPRWRHLPALGPGGANVNIVEGEGRRIAMRTWERGVEAETLACGSGAVAAALARGDLARGTEVHVASGDVLRVASERGTLWLAGPARAAYRGQLSPRIWEGC